MKLFSTQVTLLILLFTTSICFSQNPLDFGGNIRTADPSGHVWADGKMYLYVSHDEECQPDFWMKNWHVFMEEENASNNHHSIVEFKGKWILFYHRWLDINSSCGKQRHCCAEYLNFNEDGTIQKVERTDKGVGFVE